MEEGELRGIQGLLLPIACLIIVIHGHGEQKFLEQRTASIFECSSHSIFAPTACPPSLFRRICSRLKCTRSAGVKSERIRRDYARSIVSLNRRRIDGRNVVSVRRDGPSYFHWRSERPVRSIRRQCRKQALPPSPSAIIVVTIVLHAHCISVVRVIT
ncbi:hypothetical protein WN48_10999 [Eufriesea mexicana]|uniref:Uncharacterized protein n=1 Tax=Eufriesea mexicana TaxID=516756 RepID=A0A310S977_9HYME|nr:hypothetical protein WN48_10999 [Eufriesea mexicana]